MPRELDAGAVWSKELEAQNEALRKENSHLQSMMQMARAEVQRMDAVHKRHRRHSCGDDVVDVFKQEIEDLKNKLRQADSDKNDLVQSLRHMLAKNSTKTFQRQAERAMQHAENVEQMKMSVEVKCGRYRQALEAQLQAAKGKCDDTKEVAQNLQEASADLKQKLGDSQAELAKDAQKNKELASDKKQLVTTMQALMRENSRFKHDLKKVSDQEKKEAVQLVASKALLAKLAKKAPTATSAEKKQVKTMLKSLPRRHEHMSDAERAHMSHANAEIDSYMDKTEAASDDVDFVSDQQLRAVRRQEDLIAKGKVGAHLSDWLGLKPAPKPPAEGAAPKSDPVKALANPKAGADDDGEAEAEALVTQAKSQLDAMDREDAGR